MRTQSRGFSIIELVVTLTVGAILLGIAVPSFTEIIRQNRIANQTNEFMVTLAMARSEAVKRGGRVSVCSSNAQQTACAPGATNWANGWLLFSDVVAPAGEVNIDGAPPDDAIIQAWPAPSEEAMEVTSGRTYLSYDSDGRADANTVFTVRPHVCGSGAQNVRTITVNPSGRVGKAATACP
ncbi:MAG TPA: GspH/FimT family pseudopilin [Steroidobacteraceae bacterium]|nr:GspH/FimT family pseudopilin [Steroidobacteraceae bacterium]